MPRRIQTYQNPLDLSRDLLTKVDRVKRQELTDVASLRDALARGSANRLLPGAAETTKRRVTASVTPAISCAIYQDATALRLFAERVRDGAFGDFLDWVYFIGGSNSGPIKIGVSNNPRTRLEHLQIGSPEPLSLLATVNGDSWLERTLHRVFAPDRSHGEWFRRSPTLTEFVRILRLTTRSRS